MADVEPGPENDYNVAPTVVFTRARWNAVMASIAARLKARELLEASFETLISEGTQAALDLISVNVAPQLSALVEQINTLEEQLEDVISSGTATNSLQLGGQNPSFYLALANATGTLPVGQVSGVDTLIAAAVAGLVNSAPSTLDTLKELSDALGGDANFATSVATALAGKAAKASNLSDLADKDAALANILGGATGISLFKATTVPNAITVLNLTNRHVPSGSIVSVIGNVAPSGFLKANGAALSRSTYAELWTYAQACGALTSEASWAANPGCFSSGDGSTTFRIPDLRGMFDRGWDDGRGVDTGRSIGSFQDSDNKSHSHGVTDPGHSHGVNDPGHTHGVVGVANDGSFSGGGGAPYPAGGSSTNINGTGIWLSANWSYISIQNSGIAEARPKNVALLKCIKF